MKNEVTKGIEELKRQFSSASFSIREDENGGAYVIIEPILLGSKYAPNNSWIGLHITTLYPYADIYPVFIGSNVRRVDGLLFTAPITLGHHFEGREAIQISRRNGAASSGLQKATTKVLKILDFLEKLQ